MSKAYVYIATSLDGYIARKSGDIEWLHNSGHGQVDKKEDFGYEKFISTIDALVLGRKSFEKVLSFGIKWPYGTTPVFVLTNKGVEIPEEISQTVSSLSGTPAEILNELDHRGYKSLYLDGGQTIQGFLNAGLVNEITITKIPVLIGDGIPLFGPLENDIKLKHLETKSFNNGFVQCRYQVL